VLYLDARSAARRSQFGDYIPLSEQDPSLWNSHLLDEAELLLVRASRLASPGRYQFEAAIQSAHTVRRHSGRTDWVAILALYDALLQYAPSPVVVINRSVALAQVHGAAVALKSLAELEDDPRISEYQPYWAAKANFHDQLGEAGDAELAYTRAIGLASDPAVRRFLAMSTPAHIAPNQANGVGVERMKTSEREENSGTTGWRN
jgi:RNA polymerase sigma-70 factor (ECF subfamily)